MKKKLNINGTKETIIERADYPIEQCKTILEKGNHGYFRVWSARFRSRSKYA